MPINSIGRNGTTSSSHAPISESASSSKAIGPQLFPKTTRYRPVNSSAAAISSRINRDTRVLSD